jgi:hypothetical protein
MVRTTVFADEIARGEQPSFMPPPSIHVVEEGPDGVTHAEASSDGH